MRRPARLSPQLPSLLLSSAHDSDVKEAGKQKGQQQPPVQAQSAFHGSGQTATGAQFLQRSGGQYPPQAPQPGLAPNPRPASCLGHPAASLQAPGVSQHSSVQALSASLEPKSSLPGRAYQVSLHYSCGAPCFER